MAVSVQIRERVAFQKDIYTLIKDLDEQRITGELCDITLKVNGLNFYAHKAILAATSPYFRSMFTSCMREQHSQEVDLSESLGLEKPDSFKLILDYVYSGEIEINVNNAEDILRIADFLLFEDVKDYCRQFYLDCGNLNITNCFCLSELAEQHNLTEVAVVAQKMLHSRFHDHFVLSEEMTALPDAILIRILKDKELTKQTLDIDLLLCCFHWIRNDPYSRRCTINALWENIDIPWLDRIKLSPVHVITELCHKTDEELRELLTQMKQKYKEKPNPIKTLEKFKSPRRKAPKPSTAADDKCDTLLAANCNSALKYAKIMLYDIQDNVWRNLPHSDGLMSAIPARLNVCSWVQHGDFVYMFASYNLPYPTDLLRIQIVAMNLRAGEYVTHTLKHCYNTGECCKSTLTDDRSVPPAIVYCNNKVCIIGNMEGTGQVFICDLDAKTYNCFQIPGTRFISLARAVVKYNQYIYIWCRHRYGHEEFCINKDTTFVIFDIINKTFHDVPCPPTIGYGEYADPHALCLDGPDDVLIITPGKPSYILDESRNEWRQRKETTAACPALKMPISLPYHGFELYAYSNKNLYVLQNPGAFTANLLRLSTEGENLKPPPVDGISLVTSTRLEREFVKSLPVCSQFDDTFTTLIHSRTFPVEYESSRESSVAGFESESEDGFEYDDFDYDDALYGYLDDFEF